MVLGIKDSMDTRSVATTESEADNMNTIRVEMTKVDLKTGAKKDYFAMVSSEPSAEFHIYSLTYEGYRTDWKEVA